MSRKAAAFSNSWARIAASFSAAIFSISLVEVAQLGRHGGAGEARPRARLVDHVDRLVGQVAVGDEALGELHRRDERLVGVAGRGGAPRTCRAGPCRIWIVSSDGGRLDEDHLEAALQRAVLLDVLAVLVEGGGADALQLAARQGRLQHVGGVDRPLGAAGADDGVQLVDEDDRVGRLADLVHDRLEALLELAAVLRAGHDAGQIEGDEALIAQQLGHLALDDPLRPAPRRWRSCPRPARRSGSGCSSSGGRGSG